MLRESRFEIFAFASLSRSPSFRMRRHHRRLPFRPLWPNGQDSVCIIRNPAVAIVQAPTIFQQSFQSRGVNAVVCESKQDCKSPWYMTYVLTRRWDLTPYLAMGHAELYQDGQLVSSVDFSGGWGLNFAKYGRTKQKLDGMIGALLGEKTE